jgi:Succinylglutamate desuccinylase / Aspartoacylase family
MRRFRGDQQDACGPAIDSAAASLCLHCFDQFSDALLDVPASDLWRYLPGPSLFRVPGRQAQPLFVSVLLHGNEDTGWRAIQAVLRNHRSAALHRPLLLFVGNIEAAKANVRTLPGQDDYNRTWPGTSRPDSAVARLMREVIENVRREGPFASIDIHNNSGRNPHYACVNDRGAKHLHLARLFSRTVVYFEQPVGVQSAALAKICPAIAVECGRADDEASVGHAAELIASALAMQHFPDHPVRDNDLDLMQTVATIRIPPDASFSYDGADADFRFRADLDRLNFADLDSGACFGCLGRGGARRLEVTAGDVTAPFFAYPGGEIRLSQRAIPAMLTLDPDAVRLDCLGYLMRRIAHDRWPVPEWPIPE